MRLKQTHTYARRAKKLIISLAVVAASMTPLFAEEESETVEFIGLEEAPKYDQTISISSTVDYPSPFTNALAWSDGKLPHYGPTYVAGQTNGADSVLWTPLITERTVFDQIKTLILKTGCSLCLRQTSDRHDGFVFNDLRIEGTPYVYLSDNGGSTVLDGLITLEEAANPLFRAAKNRKFYINAELQGKGNLTLREMSGYTSDLDGTFYLRGLNTNWTGKLTVYASRSDVTPTLEANFARLVITNAFNLGGTLSEFTYDALTLYKMSKLIVEGKNMVLPAESNRGIFIKNVNGGRIEVPETSETFTMNIPVTFQNGARLYKEGSGRLVLGNQLWFLNKKNNFLANGVTGIGCSYYFDVREGTISAAHCDAMNGAFVAFSNNTELVMSVNPANDDIKKYGIRYDKPRGAPFATDIPIRLVETEKGCLTESKYSVALATVKADYEEDSMGKISVALDVNNYRLSALRAVANEELNAENVTTVTIYADILHNGLVISVR